MKSKGTSGSAKLGDSEIADLWNQLGPRLRAVATKFLGTGRAIEDSEHIANAAFHSLIKRVNANGEAGVILDEEQRDGLWPIAIAIARNKALQANRGESAAMRGGKMARNYADDFSDQVGDSPELFAELEELLDRLREYTEGDNITRQIVQQRLQGITSKQIAVNLKISESRVCRRLKELRRFLEESGE